MLSVMPTCDGLAAVVKCLGEVDRPVPHPEVLRRVLENLAGKGVPFDIYYPPFPKLADLRGQWVPWWEANKDKIVETTSGLGIKQEDGTISIISRKDADPTYYE
jgi:hypothetical protein